MNRSIAWTGLMVTLSVLIALSSYRFLALGFALAFPDFGIHLDARWLTFVFHVGAAPIALIVGALQFNQSIRSKRPAIHRWLGRIYVAAVMVGGISGLGLAVNAIGGPLAGLGFGLLAVLWMVFSVQGVRMARARQFAKHRRWMIRSFALTFAAVTLRIYLAGFLIAGVEYGPASVYLGWMCWVPNLLVVQWWLSFRDESQAS